MLFRDGLLKPCQSDGASLDHSSWSWKGGRMGHVKPREGRGGGGEGGEQVKKGEGRVAKKSLTNLSTGLGNV